MKKALITGVCALAFACNNSADKTAGEDAGSINSRENVEENSQENISPQLKDEEGTNNRLEVDTVSTSGSTDKQNQ